MAFISYVFHIQITNVIVKKCLFLRSVFDTIYRRGGLLKQQSDEVG